MKRPLGIYLAGISIIGLSFLAGINIVSSVASYSRSKLGNVSALSSLTDAAYGLMLAGFDQLAGWLIFPLYFIGAQAIVPVSLGISGFFLIKGRNWARKFLLLFSLVSFVFWILEAPSIMKQGVLPRMYVAAAAFLFHGFLALYLSRPRIRALFQAGSLIAALTFLLPAAGGK